MAADHIVPHCDESLHSPEAAAETQQAHYPRGDLATADTAPSEFSTHVVPLALRRRKAAEALSISERLLWTLTNQRVVPHVRLGRAIIYPVKVLEAWLAEQAAKAVRP